MENKFSVLALTFLLVLGLSVIAVQAWDAGGEWGDPTRTFSTTYALSDISTEDTVYVMLPKCRVTKVATVLSGAVATDSPVIQLAKNTTDITGGEITIGYVGSAAGDIDSCSPTASNLFDGTTEYLRIWSKGTSTNTIEVIITIFATMLN